MVDNRIDDEPLTEWDIAEMDALHSKTAKYTAYKQAQFAQQRQRQIELDALKELAEELGTSPEQLNQKLGVVESVEEAEELEEAYRQGVKDYLRKRVAAKAKKGEGGRLQDSKGRFTSVKKLAAEKAYQERVSELRAKVESGKRLSDDEILSVMPRLR